MKDTNEVPNLPTRNDVEVWRLTNDKIIDLRCENDGTIDLEPHIVTTATHHNDDTVVLDNDETYETHHDFCDPMVDVLHQS